MPQLSRFPMSNKIKEEIISSLCWLIANFNSEKEVYKFLDDFLSKTEKLMLAKRLAIALMIEKGYSYFEIRDTLKVSTSTILRISHWLDKSGEGYKIGISKLRKKEKLHNFWKEIEDLIEIVGKGKRVFPKR